MGERPFEYGWGFNICSFTDDVVVVVVSVVAGTILYAVRRGFSEEWFAAASSVVAGTIYYTVRGMSEE